MFDIQESKRTEEEVIGYNEVTENTKIGNAKTKLEELLNLTMNVSNNYVL